MFKQQTLQRVGAALQMATQLVESQPNASGTVTSPQMTEDGKMRMVASVAALLLEEDDRQSKSIILPVRG